MAGEIATEAVDIKTDHCSHTNMNRGKGGNAGTDHVNLTAIGAPKPHFQSQQTARIRPFQQCQRASMSLCWSILKQI
ncbi:MAG: hypothetical protein P8X76_16295 [Maritimibacter sp.]